MVALKWPATCRTITQEYGNRNPRYVRGYHTGIDIGCSHGNPIYAAHDGEIEFAGWNGAYGNEVRIRANTSFVTSYHHMSRIAVRKGQTVSAGKVIGYIGSTGMSTGPHLHFEVRIDGKDVDPSPYLTGASVIPASDSRQASVGSIPGAMVNAAEWLSSSTNWYRVGMVALGSVLLMMGIIGTAKTQILGKAAVNALTKGVKTNGK